MIILCLPVLQGETFHARDFRCATPDLTVPPLGAVNNLQHTNFINSVISICAELFYACNSLLLIDLVISY